MDGRLEASILLPDGYRLLLVHPLNQVGFFFDAFTIAVTDETTVPFHGVVGDMGVGTVCSRPLARLCRVSSAHQYRSLPVVHFWQPWNSLLDWTTGWRTAGAAGGAPVDASGRICAHPQRLGRHPGLYGAIWGGRHGHGCRGSWRRSRGLGWTPSHVSNHPLVRRNMRAWSGCACISAFPTRFSPFPFPSLFTRRRCLCCCA